jgi:hypothetical protein
MYGTCSKNRQENGRTADGVDVKVTVLRLSSDRVKRKMPDDCGWTTRREKLFLKSEKALEMKFAEGVSLTIVGEELFSEFEGQLAPLQALRRKKEEEKKRKERRGWLFWLNR